MRRRAPLVLVLLALVLGAVPLRAAEPRATIVTRHVKVEMDDGVRIDVNLFSPVPLAELAAPARRLPALLAQTPYRKANDPTGEIDYLVRRGYVVAMADVRGTGDSEGQWDPWTKREHVDGKLLVEWLAEQPWSTGKIGLFGTSYLGINQYFTAAQRPKGLVAMVPVQSWSDMYLDAVYRGGSFGLLDSVAYGALGTIMQVTPPQSVLDGSSEDPQRDLLAAYVRRNMAPWAARSLVDLQTHTVWDGWFDERSPATYFDEVAASGVHALHVGGWYDLFPRGVVNNFNGVASRKHAGTQRLVMGPWSHGKHPGAGGWDFQAARAGWFDRWLKGVRNGADKAPAVQVWVPGAERWRYADEWPVKAAPGVLHLHADKAGAADSQNDGSLLPAAPAPDEASVTYATDPTTGFGGGPLLIRGSAPMVTEPFDQRLEEPKLVTWSTPVFEKDVELTGPMRLVLYASTTGEDTDWVARVNRVGSDGAVELLTRGWLRASHRESHRTPTAVEPGKVYRYELEVWPTSRQFRAGERLQLAISSADLPLQLPDRRPALNTVFQDAGRPSHLVVPIVPAG
jgi:putative CocE/NonD family hydrolase